MKYSSLISSISQNKSGLWNVPDEKKVTLKRNTMGSLSKIPPRGLQKRPWHYNCGLLRDTAIKSPSSTSEALLQPSSDRREKAFTVHPVLQMSQWQQTWEGISLISQSSWVAEARKIQTPLGDNVGNLKYD